LRVSLFHFPYSRYLDPMFYFSDNFEMKSEADFRSYNHAQMERRIRQNRLEVVNEMFSMAVVDFTPLLMMGGGIAASSARAIGGFATRAVGTSFRLAASPLRTGAPIGFKSIAAYQGAWRQLASVRSYRSFSAFTRAEGSAGRGFAWHHIVEQTRGNVALFGTRAIHSTENITRLPHGAGTIHARISGYYSSKQWFTNGLTVRQWLSTQTFPELAKFGRDVILQFGGSP